MKFWSLVILGILSLPNGLLAGQQFKGVHAAIFASTGAVAVAAGEGGGGGEVNISTAWVSAKQSASAATLVITPLMTPATGNLITIPVFFGQASMTSVVDNRGNSYTLDASENRTTGLSAHVYHFIATATYNGTYNVTLTALNPTYYVAGMIISSVTAGKTVSVDVTSTSWSGSGIETAVVNMGTTPVTSANTSLCVASMYTTSAVNDAITQVLPWRLLAEEQNAPMGLAGSTVWRTYTPNTNTISVSGVAVMGNWTLAAVKQWNSCTVCYKAQ